MLLFIFISTTYIIKLKIIWVVSYFLSFRATFFFTNPDYHFIRMTSPPQRLRISEGLLYMFIYMYVCMCVLNLSYRKWGLLEKL
jgi:hypothetical protein